MQSSQQLQHTWSGLMNLVHSYHKQVLELPNDNSKFSPMAKVPTHKRRLIIMQQMHTHFLNICRDPVEVITQTDEEILFINSLKEIFQSSHLNVWSSYEAKEMAFLLADVLHRCQADKATIFAFATAAFLAVKNYNTKTVLNSELLASMIISAKLFETFPKQSSSFSSLVFKNCNLVISSAKKDKQNSDFVTASLQLILSVASQADSAFEPKDRQAIVSVICDFMKQGERAWAILSAKIYSELLRKLSFEKKHLKFLLEALNGQLSLFLYEEQCCRHLLESCLMFSPDGFKISVGMVKDNIKRVQKNIFIDGRFFAEALAAVLQKCRFESDDIFELFTSLITTNDSNSNRAIYPSVFASICFNYVHLQPNLPAVIEANSIILSFCKQTIFKKFPNYAVEILSALQRLVCIYPECFEASSFEKFDAITSHLEEIQLAGISLVLSTISQQPIVLEHQVAIIFGQIKGDFIRLSQGDPSVDEIALSGLLKLFLNLLQLALTRFPEYIEDNMLESIAEFCKIQAQNIISSQLVEQSIHVAIPLFATIALVQNKTGKHDFDLANSLLSTIPLDRISAIIPRYVNCLGLLEKSTLQKHFPLFERYIEYLDSRPIAELAGVPLYSRLVVTSLFLWDIKAQPSQLAHPTMLLAKMFTFSSYSGEIKLSYSLFQTSQSLSFLELATLFSKMFWRCHDEVKMYCLKFWSTALKSKGIVNYFQITSALEKILSAGEILTSHDMVDLIQNICQSLATNDSFKIRSAVGCCYGYIVNVVPETQIDTIQSLNDQFLKYSMAKTPNADHKMRAVFIIGLGTMHGSMRAKNIKCEEMSPRSLNGILSSLSRDSNASEIRAAVLIALSQYVSLCGDSLNAEFFRDCCEFILEQVFLHRYSYLVAESISEFIKSLSLYAKLIPGTKDMISNIVRMLLDSFYLDAFMESSMFNVLELQRINPEMVVIPRLYIQRHLSKFREEQLHDTVLLCRRLVDFDANNAFTILSDGIWSWTMKTFAKSLKGSRYTQELVDLTSEILVATFELHSDFWSKGIYSHLFVPSNSRPRGLQESLSIVESDDLVSKSAFSISDLRLELSKKIEYSSYESSIIFKAFAENIDNLKLAPLRKSVDFVQNCFKHFVYIITEKISDRSLLSACLKFLKKLIITSSEDSTSLSKFDNQFNAILSNTIQSSSSVDRDPYTCALAFDCLFGSLSFREDLRDAVFDGKSRLNRFFNEASSLLEASYNWDTYSIKSFEIFVIVRGMITVQRCGLDLSCIDKSTLSQVIRHVTVFFDCSRRGKLTNLILSKLSGQDRILFAEFALKQQIEISECIVSFLLPALNCEGTLKAAVKMIISRELNQAEIECIVKKCLGTVEGSNALREFCSSATDMVQQVIAENITIYFPTCFEHHLSFTLLAVWLREKAKLPIQETFNIAEKFINWTLNNFSESYSKPVILAIKSLLSLGHATSEFNSAAQIFLDKYMKNIDGPSEQSFLLQLVTFCVCTHPALWEKATYETFKDTLVRKLNYNEGNNNNIQMIVENWVLLLKTMSKGDFAVGSDFANLVSAVTKSIESSLEWAKLNTDLLNLLNFAKSLYIQCGLDTSTLDSILANKN